MSTASFVGFSLGNTNSMVALCSEDGKTHVIANEEGDRAIPSVLSFDGDEIFHGTEARKRLISHPNCTFNGFVDEYFLSGKESTLERSIGESKITAGDLMRQHVLKLKECVENYTGEAVRGVVISIPSGSSKSKQEEFNNLVKGCGFSVVQLANEASCCLTAYETWANRDDEEGFDAVLDLSGSKFTISLFKPSKGKYGLFASGSNPAISGSSLDIILRDYLVSLFKKEHKLDILSDKALSRLQQEAEAARITLSSSSKATISIDSLFGNCDLHTTITKLRLDMLFRSFYRELGEYINNFLNEHGLDHSDIRTVALCGGVANTPKITSLVQSILSTSKILSPAESYDVSAFTIEACARGAALQGSLLSSVLLEELPHYLDTELHLSVPSNDIFLQITGKDMPILLYGRTSPLGECVSREVSIDAADIHFQVCEGHWESAPVATGGGEEGEDGDEDMDDEPRRIYKEDKVLLKGSLQNLPLDQTLLVKVYTQNKLSLEFHIGKQDLVNFMGNGSS